MTNNPKCMAADIVKVVDDYPGRAPGVLFTDLCQKVAGFADPNGDLGFSIERDGRQIVLWIGLSPTAVKALRLVGEFTDPLRFWPISPMAYLYDSVDSYLLGMKILDGGPPPKKAKPGTEFWQPVAMTRRSRLERFLDEKG